MKRGLMEKRISCFFAGLLWRLVPLMAFRRWLLKIHLDGCQVCQQELAGPEESRRALAAVENAFPERLLAAAAAGRVPDDSRIEGQSGLLVRVYAGTTAAIIVCLLAAFSWQFIRNSDSGGFSFANGTNKTEIVSSVSLEYVRAQGRPADTYIYRTDNPEMVIIWVESSN